MAQLLTQLNNLEMTKIFITGSATFPTSVTLLALLLNGMLNLQGTLGKIKNVIISLNAREILSFPTAGPHASGIS